MQSQQSYKITVNPPSSIEMKNKPPVHQASFVQGTKSLEILTEERSLNGTDVKMNSVFHTTANDCIPSTTLSENVLCQSKLCWTQAYFEMPLPVEWSYGKAVLEPKLTIEQATLPLSYQIQGPSSSFIAPQKKPHTIHQLLLVLSYLFISAMLPGDEGALWRIIYRSGNDWEKGFVLQYDGLLSWFVAAREALTRSEALHSMSLEDLELQIRYILFILGQHASCHSSFLHTCYQRPLPPYRPFGTKASVALISHAFMGIQAADMDGYEYKEIWVCGEEFLSTMAFQLKKSPLFQAGISIHQLQSMILSLQRAFQLEEVRVASTKPQKILIGNDSDRMEYYRRAFLSLNPMLLPKILTSAMGIELMADLSTDCLATLLAKIFHNAYPMKDLEAAFKKVPEILLSKADRIVATEMFHDKQKRN
ncbi:uncharacterized protein N7473_004364 [Penicillium subrubescens]|uniref:uncharacterized protein n=1 Tax=Penicillium subrubescens TaxID=1316194 RepID=UPI00254559E2|nr:uncharacterized protein N7473_004364 [Penicillium subrubescens]KAJ5900294.1 hypothetical protein N7473_004364 [Penicillium subrubescens]